MPTTLDVKIILAILKRLAKTLITLIEKAEKGEPI